MNNSLDLLSVEYTEQADGSYTCKSDGGIIKCCVCSKPLQYRKHGKYYYNDHKCSAQVEGGRDGCDRHSDDDVKQRTPTRDERLRAGFRLLQMAGDA